MTYSVKGWLNPRELNEFAARTPTAADALVIGRAFAVTCSSLVTITTPDGGRYSVAKFAATLAV